MNVDVPLIAAATRGDRLTVEALLAENPAAARLADDQGFTALMRAALAGHVGCVEVLLGASNVNQAHLPTGRVALEMALEQEWRACAELLSPDTRKNAQDPKTGWTPLMRAVRGRRLTATEFLVSCSDLNVRDHQGLSALDWAACTWPYGIEILLTNGGEEIQTHHPEGLTPLMFAMMNGNIGCARHAQNIHTTQSGNIRTQVDRAGRDAFAHGLLSGHAIQIKAWNTFGTSKERMQEWLEAVHAAQEAMQNDATAKAQTPSSAALVKVALNVQPELHHPRSKPSERKEKKAAKEAKEAQKPAPARVLVERSGPREYTARLDWLQSMERPLRQYLALQKEKNETQRVRGIASSMDIANEGRRKKKALSKKQIESGALLVRAVFFKNSTEVQAQLDCGAPLLSDSRGTSPLMMAAQRGDLDIVQLLLPHSNANARDNRHLNALTFALQERHWECANALLAHTDPNDADPSTGITNLMAVIRACRPEMIQAWLGAADLTRTDDSGRTALMHATESRPRVHNPDVDHHVTVVRLLLPGSDPLAIDSNGNTALINAVHSENWTAIQPLIARSNVHAQNETGTDALMMAVLCEHKPSVKALLPHADLSQYNTSGMSAWRIACESKNTAIIDAFAAWIDEPKRALVLRRWGPAALPHMHAMQEQGELTRALQRQSAPSSIERSSPPVPADGSPLARRATPRRARSL